MDIEITPLRNGDQVTVQTVFDGMSPEARFHRYLQAMPALRPAHRRLLADVERPEHRAWVARDGNRPVGIVRIATDAEGAAELAVEVVDAVRGMGLGRRLVEHALTEAAEAGVPMLSLLVHPTNTASRGLFRSMGVDFVLEDGLLVGRLPVRSLAAVA